MEINDRYFITLLDLFGLRIIVRPLITANDDQVTWGICHAANWFHQFPTTAITHLDPHLDTLTEGYWYFKRAITNAPNWSFGLARVGLGLARALTAAGVCPAY